MEQRNDDRKPLPPSKWKDGVYSKNPVLGRHNQGQQRSVEIEGWATWEERRKTEEVRGRKWLSGEKPHKCSRCKHWEQKETSGGDWEAGWKRSDNYCSQKKYQFQKVSFSQ